MHNKLVSLNADILKVDVVQVDVLDLKVPNNNPKRRQQSAVSDKF